MEKEGTNRLVMELGITETIMTQNNLEWTLCLMRKHGNVYILLGHRVRKIPTLVMRLRLPGIDPSCPLNIPLCQVVLKLGSHEKVQKQSLHYDSE